MSLRDKPEDYFLTYNMVRNTDFTYYGRVLETGAREHNIYVIFSSQHRQELAGLCLYLQNVSTDHITLDAQERQNSKEVCTVMTRHPFRNRRGFKDVS